MPENQNALNDDAPKKKRGVVKTVAFGLFLPITAPFYILKWIVRDIVTLAKAIITSIPIRIREEKARWRTSVAEEKARPAVDVWEVLAGWGVTNEQEVNMKRRELNFHLCIWSALFLFGWYIVFTKTTSMKLYAGLLIVAIGMLGMLNAFWRKDILNSKKFVYFTDWLKCKY